MGDDASGRCTSNRETSLDLQCPWKSSRESSDRRHTYNRSISRRFFWRAVWRFPTLKTERVPIDQGSSQPTWILHKVTQITDIRFLRHVNPSTVIGPRGKFQGAILFVYQQETSLLPNMEISLYRRGKIARRWDMNFGRCPWITTSLYLRQRPSHSSIFDWATRDYQHSKWKDLLHGSVRLSRIS